MNASKVHKTLTVKVTPIFPPIPTTAYDWVAHMDGYEENGPQGHGSTPAAALAELADELAELVAGGWDL